MESLKHQRKIEVLKDIGNVLFPTSPGPGLSTADDPSPTPFYLDDKRLDLLWGRLRNSIKNEYEMDPYPGLIMAIVD